LIFIKLAPALARPGPLAVGRQLAEEQDGQRQRLELRHVVFDHFQLLEHVVVAQVEI
jgi:hypothetical protein